MTDTPPSVHPMNSPTLVLNQPQTGSAGFVFLFRTRMFRCRSSGRLWQIIALSWGSWSLQIEKLLSAEGIVVLWRVESHRFSCWPPLGHLASPGMGGVMNTGLSRGLRPAELGCLIALACISCGALASALFHLHQRVLMNIAPKWAAPPKEWNEPNEGGKLPQLLCLLSRVCRSEIENLMQFCWVSGLIVSMLHGLCCHQAAPQWAT